MILHCPKELVVYGFRAKRSCETQLILTLEDILKTTSKGKQIDIVLLDFSKAFDT
jgi:hypothetical protein